VKWYWVVSCDQTVDDPVVADCADLKGFDEAALLNGQPLDSWDASAWFQATNPEDDGTPDDVLQNHLGLPIFSQRLRNALEEAGIRDIQYLPVTVIRPDGHRLTGFSIGNVLRLVPALDLQKSDYDVFPQDYFLPTRRGMVQGIRRAVLLGHALNEYDVIRLKEFKRGLYVSERFTSVFGAGRFTGYSFHEVPVSFAA
jgi:hypothetical protein